MFLHQGDGRRHVEYPIHTEIYRSRPDVASVVHVHPMHVIAFAATTAPLRALSHDAVPFTPPDVCRFTETGNLIRTGELGGRLAEALGQRNAVLIPNHGMVTVGPDLATAVFLAVLLDKACRQHLLAGEVRAWSADEEARAKRDDCWPPSQIQSGYDYLRRRAARRVDVPNPTK